MKKQITALFAAALMLAALTACGGESSTPELSSAGETTTSSTGVTTEKTETTTTTRVTVTTTASTSEAAENTTASVTTTEPPVSSIETTMSTVKSESTDNRETPVQTTTHRMEALAKKIRSTNDAVLIHEIVEQNGMKTDIAVTTYGERYYMKVDVVGKFVIKACCDGKNQYLINDKTRNYALNNGEENVNPQDALTTESVGTFMEDGTEKYKTKTCFYEDYESNQDDEKQRTRYYFNGDELVGIKVLTGSDAGEIMDCTVKFHSSVDVSLFSPPKGYEEVDKDEMSVQIFELLFGSVQ